MFFYSKHGQPETTRARIEELLADKNNDEVVVSKLDDFDGYRISFGRKDIDSLPFGFINLAFYVKVKVTSDGVEYFVYPNLIAAILFLVFFGAILCDWVFESHRFAKYFLLTSILYSIGIAYIFMKRVQRRINQS